MPPFFHTRGLIRDCARGRGARAHAPRLDDARHEPAPKHGRRALWTADLAAEPAHRVLITPGYALGTS